MIVIQIIIALLMAVDAQNGGLIAYNKEYEYRIRFTKNAYQQFTIHSRVLELKDDPYFPLPKRMKNDIIGDFLKEFYSEQDK